MLALDDAALAPVMIAATAMTANARRTWLRKFAAAAEPIFPPPRTSAARRGERQRKARARWRDGIAISRIAAHHDYLVHACSRPDGSTSMPHSYEPTRARPRMAAFAKSWRRE
jgi:hypothetical protein